MKKSLIGKITEAVIAKFMYPTIKVKEVYDKLIKSKNKRIIKRKKEIILHQEFISECQKNKKESDEKINSNRIFIAEFIAKHSKK